MPFDVNEAVDLGQRVVDAYTLYKTGDPACLRLPPGYLLLATIYADDITDNSNDYVIFGFIAGSRDDVLVAIRGTKGVFEWVWDFDSSFTPFDAGGRTEAGFAHFYDTLRTGKTDASRRVIDVLCDMFRGGFTGRLRIAAHSLGSAVAAMLALDLVVKLPGREVRLVVYTFGSPLVGDASFVHAYNTAVKDSWRIANDHDIVTEVPSPRLGYAHVDTLVPIDSGTATKQKWSCWHQLKTYLHTLDPRVPLDDCCLPGSPPTLF